MAVSLFRPLILICFCASGAAALICQVVWARQLAIPLGATVNAVATVLAAFMGGLALGGLVGGRWADTHPGGRSRAYAMLEIGTAILALLSPYAWAALATFPYPLPAAFLLLLLPTMLMGATMPVLVRLVTEGLDEVGGCIADLYAANTTGAMTGALLAGFFLVPRWGLTGSLRVAAALCLVAGLLCWSLPAVARPSEQEGTSAQAARPRGATGSRLAIALFGLCGFVALALEVLWTRALITYLGNSVYAFSVMLFVFLAGLALGGVIVGYVCDSLADPRSSLAFVVAGAGLAGLLASVAFLLLPDLLAAGGRHAPSFGLYILLQVAMAAVILLPMTCLFGGTFPLVVRICTPRLSELGRTVGLAYFWNTLGGILGSVTAALLLLPAAGAQRSILALSGILALAGCAALWAQGKRGAVLFMGAPAVALVLLSPTWNSALLLRGADVAFRLLEGKAFTNLASWRPIFYKEGRHSTVVVGENPSGHRNLSINGQIQASSVPEDRFLQEAIGHLPMLFAPDHNSVLVIGMGSGMTAAAVARHQPRLLRLAELEPAVVAAGNLFRTWNAPLWTLPGLELRLTDGRWLVARDNTSYDVITSDPIHPLEAGASSLYTVEHFLNCRKRLAQGGIMAQWLPLYGLSQKDAQRVIGSFCEAFPEASLWCYYPAHKKGDAILLGTRDGTPLSSALLEPRLLALRQQGVETWRSAGEVTDGFVMEGERLRRYAGDLRNTDDMPLLEFETPRSAYLWTPQRYREDLAAVLEAGGKYDQ